MAVAVDGFMARVFPPLGESKERYLNQSHFARLILDIIDGKVGKDEINSMSKFVARHREVENLEDSKDIYSFIVDNFDTLPSMRIRDHVVRLEEDANAYFSELE